MGISLAIRGSWGYVCMSHTWKSHITQKSISIDGVRDGVHTGWVCHGYLEEAEAVYVFDIGMCHVTYVNESRPTETQVHWWSSWRNRQRLGISRAVGGSRGYVCLQRLFASAARGARLWVRSHCLSIWITFFFFHVDDVFLPHMLSASSRVQRIVLVSRSGLIASQFVLLYVLPLNSCVV